jgi:hypothetical protein
MGSNGIESESPKHGDSVAVSEHPFILLSQSPTMVISQWKRCTQMLSTHPALMTNEILCMALEHRPPLHIVQCMLQLNPEAAFLPESGLSALQVAVQSHCSVNVVECLIRAYPLALVKTNANNDIDSRNSCHLDPLSYAKRFRSQETDLIQLLRLPLRHWMHPDNISLAGFSSVSGSSSPPTGNLAASILAKFQPTSKSSVKHKEAENECRVTTVSSFDDCSEATPVTENHGERATVASLLETKSRPGSPEGTLGAVPRSCSGQWAFPLTSILAEGGKSSPSSINTPSTKVEDPNELANIKVICLAVIRGHERLSAQLKSLAEAEEKRQQSDLKHLNALQEDMLKKVDQRLKEQLKSQLIVLDSTEQQMRARVGRLERRLVRRVSQRQQEWSQHFWDQREASIVQFARNHIEGFHNDLMDDQESHKTSDLTVVTRRRLNKTARLSTNMAEEECDVV